MNRALKELNARDVVLPVCASSQATGLRYGAGGPARGCSRCPVIDWDNPFWSISVPAKAQAEVPSAVGSGLSLGDTRTTANEAGHSGRRPVLRA